MLIVTMTTNKAYKQSKLHCTKTTMPIISSIVIYNVFTAINNIYLCVYSTLLLDVSLL